MKILILSDDFPPERLGGAGIIAFDLAERLQKLGHQIYVITTVRDRARSGRLNYRKLTIFRVHTNYCGRWRAYLGLYNPRTVSQVKRIFKQIRPDIAHIHNVHCYLSYYCLKIAKKYSKAVFLTAHDEMLFHYGKLTEFIDPDNLLIPKTFNYKISCWQQIKRFKKRYNPFRNIVIRHYLKYVDKIFAVSYTLKEALSQNNIGNAGVIHNGIDAVQWRVDNDKLEIFKKKRNLFNRKIVFFAGRLSALKGGEKIVEAMKIVAKRIPDAVLLIVGKKDGYAREMLRLTEKENLPLVFTGWIEGDELKSAYHSSNVVVTPSIYLDPFNLINIEAMACKKPVVGTCFGGTSEIVQDGKTGYIVNPLDVETMAEKIVDLLENVSRADKFGQSGYERVKKKFSLKKQMEETLEWYKKYI